MSVIINSRWSATIRLASATQCAATMNFCLLRRHCVSLTPLPGYQSSSSNTFRLAKLRRTVQPPFAVALLGRSLLARLFAAVVVVHSKVAKASSSSSIISWTSRGPKPKRHVAGESRWRSSPPCGGPRHEVVTRLYFHSADGTKARRRPSRNCSPNIQCAVRRISGSVHCPM